LNVGSVALKAMSTKNLLTRKSADKNNMEVAQIF
jgi:hypothetical protein